MKSKDVNVLIWCTVSKADPEVLEARFRPNRQYEPRTDKSSLVITLSKAEWIPDKRGRFHKPCEITKEQLHPDFKYKYDNPNGWLDEIGFEENAKKESEEYRTRNSQAKELGFASADEAAKYAALARMMKEKKKSPDDLISQLKPSNPDKPAFPTRAVSNPDRRHDRLLEQLNDAPEKEYEKRDRSVRTTKGTIDPNVWLRSQYTNEMGQMVCQICEKEMPFRGRDGEYYFEAVEALSEDYFSKEHEAQFLALCPLCAAKYKEFVRRDENAMNDLKSALMNSKELKVSLQLGETKTSIRFVESHWRDMRTILQERG